MARRIDFGDIDDDPIYIGEDLTFRIQMVKKNSAGVDVVEGDVSANAYLMTVKKSPGDSTALIDLATGAEITFANGDTTINELAGTNTVLVIAMSDTETELIPEEGLYHFDIGRTDSGNESLVVCGTINFSDSVRL